MAGPGPMVAATCLWYLGYYDGAFRFHIYHHDGFRVLPLAFHSVAMAEDYRFRTHSHIQRLLEHSQDVGVLPDVVPVVSPSPGECRIEGDCQKVHESVLLAAVSPWLRRHVA